MSQAGYQVYLVFLGMKAHFSSPRFNYLKNPAVKTSQKTFRERNDHKFFSLYAKYPEKELEHIFLANMIDDPDFWIGNREAVINVYKEWQKRVQSLKYRFTEELRCIKPEDMEGMIKTSDLNLPGVVSLFLQKKIGLETLVILSDCFSCLNYWNKQMKENIIWPFLSLRISKYRLFLETRYDRSEYLKIIKDHMKKGKAQNTQNTLTNVPT